MIYSKVYAGATEYRSTYCLKQTNTLRGGVGGKPGVAGLIHGFSQSVG